MSSKKKLIVSLSVAAAVLVAAVIAIVAVFAAAQQTIASNVKISYTVSDVQGSVEASYAVEGESETPIGTWSFSADDTTAQKDLNTENIVITLEGSSKDEVVFSYTFKNSGSKNMKITQSFTAPGYTVTYSVAGSGYNAYPESVILKGMDAPVTASNPANSIIILVKVKVTDNAFELAEQSFEFGWTMAATSDTATHPVVVQG